MTTETSKKKKKDKVWCKKANDTNNIINTENFIKNKSTRSRASILPILSMLNFLREVTPYMNDDELDEYESTHLPDRVSIRKAR